MKSPKRELLGITFSSRLTRRLVLQSDSDEEADPSQVTADCPTPGHLADDKTANDVPPSQSLEADEELIKLLWDVKEVATIGVEVDEDDDIIEVGNDNQSC